VTTTLIRNPLVVPVDDASSREFRASILVRDGKIAAIGPHIEEPAAEVIEADGMIVVPGFVDAHRHTWQTQLRGTATDWSLFDYLARMRLGYSGLYSPQDVLLGNYAGALEALNAGVTTLVDHSHIMNSPAHADAAIQALDQSGVRAIFCFGIYNNPPDGNLGALDRSPERLYRDAERVATALRATADGRLLFGVAPSEAESAPIEVVADEIRWARSLNAQRISYHVAMGCYDRGHQVVGKLGELDLLRDDLLFVHGAALTDRELGWMRDCGASLCVTPETEMQMGMGHPAGFRARDAQVACGLGIDIVSNYAGDMFSQMRLMLQAGRAADNMELGRRQVAPRKLRRAAFDVLHMATLGGAKALGLADRIGSIEVGKDADLVLIRTDSINMTPVTDAVGAVVLHANASDVDTVMVHGKPLKRKGELVNAGWPEIRAQLVESSERIRRRFDQLDHVLMEGMFTQYLTNLE
jgi:cytosine/adenosine deaminase-related metal-dependent hydrolase